METSAKTSDNVEEVIIKSPPIPPLACKLKFLSGVLADFKIGI
jgi:hypothetical protein